MPRELLTVRQAVSEYGLPRDQLYGLIREGRLPVLGTERRFLIPRRVIEDMLDALVEEARRTRRNSAPAEDVA